MLWYSIISKFILTLHAESVCPMPDHLRWLYQNNDVEEICQQANTQHAYDFGALHRPREEASGNYYRAYTDSMSATTEERFLAISHQEMALKNFLPFMGGYGINAQNTSDVFSYYAKASEQTRVPSTQEISQFSAEHFTINSQSEQSKNFAPLACAPLGCASAMLRAIDLMNVQELTVKNPISSTGGAFAYIPAYQDVFTNSDYVAPLAYAATAMKEKSDHPEKHHPLGSFYQDLVDAFIHYGHSPSDSQTMAINVLGIYGTRGVPAVPQWEMAARLGKGPMVTMAAIGMMAAESNYLEGLAIDRGENYALPPGVHSNCLYLRPYHFWMSAYLAQKLKQQGFADNDIFEAIHLLNVLYEKFGAVATNKTKYEKLESLIDGDPSYWGLFVETQKDIAFNDAGLFWMLQNPQASPSVSLDVDQILSPMFKSSMVNDQIQNDQGMQLISEIIASLVKNKTGMDFNPELYFMWDLKSGAQDPLMLSEILLH